MKLVIAIVNNDDAHFVNTGLTSSGFHVTKISSTGGFLMNGNSTFLLGVEEADLDKALDVIKTHCQQRTQDVPVVNSGTNIISTPSMRISI
ncbi:MAG: cyclic-di-AMP receptor [Clostridia bacterium]|nr:cyclic-di-AMP receptor [Clostridia bacterium]